MVQHKVKDKESNLSHQSQSTISGELDCEQESVVKGHESSSMFQEADTQLNHLKTKKENLDFRRHDSVLPASMSSNQSHQKTLKETDLFRAIDSCSSESVRSESDVSAQIAVKISSMVARDSPLHITEVSNEDNSQELDDVTIASENGVADISNGTAPVFSDDSYSFDPRNKVKEDMKSPTDPDKGIINSEIAKGSCETQEIQTVKEDSDESSRPDKVSIKNHDTCVLGFDLNEDITMNVMEDYYIIRVAAKAGIPKDLPVFPLTFEGQRGWTGPSETSAFRVIVPKTRDHKACPRTNSPNNQKRLLGFDLNVSCGR